MTHVFDLHAYSQRIGFVGLFQPTLEVLSAISECHSRSIPFENLDVLAGKPIDLDPAALERKLVFGRRGGYCFEQNGLMLGILQQIGFEVTPLAGRVRLESTREVLPPRTHLFLSVAVGSETWLFDVGVGGFTLTSPIRQLSEAEQITLHETRRIERVDDRYFHLVWTGTQWQDVYEFSGETMPEIDREVANWWTSTSPRAKFSQNLFCAIAGSSGERKGIQNDRFIRRIGGDIVEKRVIETADELLEVLGSEFGLCFSPGTRFGTGKRRWPN